MKNKDKIEPYINHVIKNQKAADAKNIFKSVNSNFSYVEIFNKYKLTPEQYLMSLIDPNSVCFVDKMFTFSQINTIITMFKAHFPDVKLTDDITNAIDEISDILEEEEAKKDLGKTKITRTKLATNQSITAGLEFKLDIGKVLKDAAEQYLESDEAGINDFIVKNIKNEVTKLIPNQFVIDNVVVSEIKGKLHSSFKTLLEILKVEKQCFICGPAGTGKTTLASQAATAMNIPFGHISCTAGMSEAHLLGRMIADGSYIGSDFVNIYEKGGVFLLDEIDASDPNTLLIINSALANGYMSVPNRKDNARAVRHKDCYIICAANTWGNGSNQYSGRSILDSAFLDRFAMSKLEVNYDVKLEEDILKDYPAIALNLWKIRDNVNANKLRRIISTRSFVSAAKNASIGKKSSEILEKLFIGWTNEERTKAIKDVKYQ